MECNTSFTCLSVLLNAVAAVIELGKRGGQFVQVVADAMEEEIIQTLQHHFRVPEHALGQLPFFGMIEF